MGSFPEIGIPLAWAAGWDPALIAGHLPKGNAGLAEVPQVMRKVMRKAQTAGLCLLVRGRS